jgi:hypothetical protein
VEAAGFYGVTVEEGLEPGPGGRAEEAEEDGADGEDRERGGHDRGALVGVAGAVVLGVFGVGLVVGDGAMGGEAEGSEEDVADLAGHVEGGEQRAEGRHVERRLRDGPVVGGVEDGVLRPEAGEDQREAAEGEHADGVGGEGKGHVAAEAAHAADILLAPAAVDNGACAEEEEGLEECVGDEVEHADRRAADAEAEHHVAELRDGGVSEDALDVPLRDGDGGAEESGDGSDPGDDLEGQ